MYKSKLIGLLKSLEVNESKEMKDFLNSPFHNKNSNVIKLFNAVMKYYPEFESRNLTKEKIYSKIFPGKKYNDQVIRILVSELMRLYEKYFGVKLLMETPLVDLKALRTYSDKKLEKNFDIKIKTIKKNLMSNDGYDEFVIQMLVDIEHEKLHNFVTFGKYKELCSVTEKRGEYIIYHTLVRLLKTERFFKSLTDMVNYDFSDSVVKCFFDEINFQKLLDKVKEKDIEFYNILSIYYYGNRCQTDNIETDFLIFKEIFYNNFKLFSYYERYNVSLLFESICFNKINSGNFIFNKELNELYNFLIEENRYKYAPWDYIAFNRIINMVNVGLNLRNIEWLEMLKERFLKEVNPSYSASVEFYINAVIHFLKKEHDLSLANISRMDNSQFVFKYLIKDLSLMNYFELKDINMAFQLLDSYKHFISNNKQVSSTMKTLYLNFIKYYSGILSLKEKGDYSDLDFLRKEIDKHDNLIHRNWLIEKLDENQ